MSKRSKLAYPFNLVQDIFSWSNSKMKAYMSAPPKDLDATIQYVLSCILNEKEKKIILKYYNDRMTLERISKMCNVSKHNVQHLKSTALRKLKYSTRTKQFIKYGILSHIKQIEAQS